MSQQTIDKSKFALVERDSKILDEAFQTKAIGYYKDAWFRFRKNKASVVAAIILILLIIMAIIGPFFVSYELDDQHAPWAQRLANMPPKSELLDFIPMWSGEKELTGSVQNFSNLPAGMVEIISFNPNTDQVTVRLDYYEYIAHHYSAEINPDTQTYAASAYTNLTAEEYNKVLDAQEEFGVVIILEDKYEEAKAAMIPLQEALDAAIADGDVEDIADAQAAVNAQQIVVDRTQNEVDAGIHKLRLDYFAFLKYIYGIDEISFFFGSDGSGRDLFKELWKGARVSLMISFTVAAINIIVGVIIGSISGYYGGTVDLVMERVSEILAGLPFLAILTLLLLRFGNSPFVVILAFTMTGWLGISALTRSQFYRYKNREYVLAARTLGAGDRRIMYRHIFPSAVGTIITRVVLYIPGVIFTESTYSFLGIINYGDIISVGRLMSNGQLVMKDSFYQLLFPAIFISLLMLSFNLFGNGLRDAFNPSLRGVEE
jgi:oligopeptide transport system permease protein